MLPRERNRGLPREEELAELVRAAQESGELRHLYGRPLDLTDTSPDWFITRTLRREGVTHPALQRRRELEAQRSDVEAIVDQLRRRRDRVASFGAERFPWRAHDFNASREYELRRYRERLQVFNRAVRDYNITVPTALQFPYAQIEEEVRRAEGQVPVLDVHPAELEDPVVVSRLRSLINRLRPGLPRQR